MNRSVRSSKKPKATPVDTVRSSKKLPDSETYVQRLKMEKRSRRTSKEQDVKLSEGELRHYSRQIMLDEIGYNGQRLLKSGKVCVIGLGGLGSTAAIQLAAMGVGNLRLVDRDVVEESNLQRQHLYNFDVIGVPKVEAAVKRLKRMNPYVKFESLPRALDERNADEILKGVDVVVDGLDNMRTRYAVNRACIRMKIPYVFGAAISNFGNATTIIPQKTACLECFYGNLDDSILPTCSTIGVHPAVLGIVASIEVAETVKILLGGKPSLTNKLFYCDVGAMRFEHIKIAQLESCSVCGRQPKANPIPLKRSLIEEGCGRNKNRVFVMVPKENLNLKMRKLSGILKQEGAKLKVKAELGLTFTASKAVLVSILKSGIMIIEGTNSEEAALSFYKKLIVEKMGISWSHVV